MKQTKIANLPIYKFSIFEKIPEVEAVVTTRLGGKSKGKYSELNLGLHVGDNLNDVLVNRSTFANAIGISENDITCGQQSHSINVQQVETDEIGRGAKSWENGFPETDALITRTANLPLAVLTADCAGVFIYDPVNKAVGVAHSGRKGTEGEILTKTIQKMHDIYGTCPENIIAGIGPCIYPCCYELNLPKTIKAQLLQAGVKLENIEESGICTSCNNDIFYSYRADKKQTGRMINLIMLRRDS